jgi:hypothetical protein
MDDEGRKERRLRKARMWKKEGEERMAKEGRKEG